MKRIKSLLVFLMVGFVLQTSAAPVFDIPVKIFKAIEIGDVENLSVHFSESIELIILDQEDIYSRQQANLILKDFFNKNRPTKFTVLHQGGTEKAKYAIGKLVTSSGTYRVHFLVKMKDGKPLIHQLRIQEE
ncbi:MAG: DUF4783 domain-containing protein [Bacteroidales bacterium]|jgi:hypothetical protein|nr:DUF4783 domain-containing protein [Bacteroidales bacterium]